LFHVQSESELKRKKMLKMFGIGGAALAFIGIGILCGYFIGRAVTQAGGSSGSSSTGSAGVDYRELPPPGTAEAQALIDDPETPGKISHSSWGLKPM
jgi:hypothetical protein